VKWSGFSQLGNSVPSGRRELSAKIGDLSVTEK
jgi:hypothetical protein